jgi:hypothetical protein
MRFATRRELLWSLLSTPVQDTAERHLGGLLLRCPTCGDLWLTPGDTGSAASHAVANKPRHRSSLRTRRPPAP